MRRPPKPRILREHLSWVWRPHAKAWVPYHRITWTEGGKRRQRTVKLDWKGDPQELDRLYWLAQNGQHDAQATPGRYTWHECIRAWRADPRIQGKLAAGTKRSYRHDMDAIAEKNGPKDMRRTTRKALRQKHHAMSATPRSADRMLTTVSLLWNYAARTLEWPLPDNPTTGIERFGRQREFLPWPEWMVAALDTAPPEVELTARLILGTGQRPSASIAMRWEQFSGEWMTVTDEKGDEELEVYCPIPLRETLAKVPRKGEHVIAKNLREPLTYDAMSKRFRNWRKTLGDKAKPYSLHGLRKLAIIQLAEAGATDAEIQAVTGQSAETVAYYRRLANRKRLSRAAQQRRT